MPRRPVEFRPAALEEARAAAVWYRERSPAAADAFNDEITKAIKEIVSAPERWPQYRSGTRRFVLHRFPFFVVYRAQPNVVHVIAVAHARRRPGYWNRGASSPDRY
jgi:plasmid stabilization system protein ParE